MLRGRIFVGAENYLSADGLSTRTQTFLRSVRAGEGTRTLDNQLGRLELYQLSYTRVIRFCTLFERSSPVESNLDKPSLEGWSSTN